MFALLRALSTARVVRVQNFASRRRAEGLRQWASLWNSELCYEDGLHFIHHGIRWRCLALVVEYFSRGAGGSRGKKTGARGAWRRLNTKHGG